MASTGNALEEWHRYVVPGLLDRIQTRVKQHCDDSHQSWPARARFAHYRAADQVRVRLKALRSDLHTRPPNADGPDGPRLMIADDNDPVPDPRTGGMS